MNAGSGGDTLASDDIAGVKHPRVKIEHGADGSATDVSTASPLPTVLQTAQAADGAALPTTGVQVGGTDGSVFQVLAMDASGRAQVGVGTALPAGTNAIGKLAANSGVDIGDVDVTSLPAGSQAAATAKTADYDTGAGTDTVAMQGIALPKSGGAVAGGTSTDPVRTDPTGTTTQPVSGTVTASGPLTDTQLRASAVPVDSELPAAAALADATANPTVPFVGAGALLFNGTTWDRVRGDTTNGIDVDVTRVGGNVTVVNGGTFAVQIAANSSVNQAQVAGTTTDTNSGVKSAGTQRVVLATDQPQLTNALKVDGSAVTQPVSGTVTANLGTAAVTNAGTFAVQDSEKIADDAAFSVASTKLTPVGYLADQTSTDSVNEGDIGAARITLDRKQIVTVGPSADTEGLTTYHLVSAASTNATNVKASAGKLHGWYIYNSNAAARKLVFHNASGTPTAGASVFFSVMIPPTSAANVFGEIGIAFSTGIAITTVTGLADSDSTAVAVNDLIINLWYV